MGIQQEQPPVTSSQRTATADLFGDPIDSHPLWFKQSSFLSPDFDSESYISDLRTFVPFETLRSELQSHLSSLKHELVELINRDYADFVNLSTKLVDVDAAVLRMRAPLIEIRDKILAFRGAVEGSLVSLQGGLRQRAETSAAREILELLIDTSHVVSKVMSVFRRYANWLSAGLSARKTRNTGSNSPFEWALVAAPDDFVYIINDLDNLAAEVCGNYIIHMFEIIKSSSTEEVLDLVKNSILQGGKSLKDLVPSVIDSIIETLVEKSNEELKQLHGIVAAYRMTKKPPPVRHSHYVSGVLRPLKVFLDGERATTYLTEDIKSKLVQGAAFKITGRYHELAADIVNTARKTETSLQRIRLGAQRRAGASSDVSDHNVSETERICMQLFLDIQEYGRNLATLGVEATKIPAYSSLWQLVAPQDRQAEISF